MSSRRYQNSRRSHSFNAEPSWLSASDFEAEPEDVEVVYENDDGEVEMVVFSPEPTVQEEISEEEPVSEETSHIFEEPEPVEEATDADEASLAFKLIAGALGGDESDIRKKISELGGDYDNVIAVKKQILDGTYYNG